MKWDTFKPIVVLTAICIVISGALVGTYSMTKPVIDAAKAEEERLALMAVLPEGKNFEAIDVAAENIVSAYVDTEGAGYVFMAQGKGFAGAISVMVGIGSDGLITGTQVMEHGETPGIGDKMITEEWFQPQYVGKDQNLEGVESITGATFSSKGFNAAITAAYAAYGEVAGVEIEVPAKDPVYPEAALVASMLGDSYEEITVDGMDSAYASDAGYAFNVAAEGFADDIHVLVAIDNNGAIIAAKMYQYMETPDYGAKLAKDSFSAKWVGLTAESDMPAVSGSTVTSNAYKTCVEAAFAAYETVKGA